MQGVTVCVPLAALSMIRTLYAAMGFENDGPLHFKKS